MRANRAVRARAHAALIAEVARPIGRAPDLPRLPPWRRSAPSRECWYIEARHAPEGPPTSAGLKAARLPVRLMRPCRSAQRRPDPGPCRGGAGNRL